MKAVVIAGVLGVWMPVALGALAVAGVVSESTEAPTVPTAAVVTQMTAMLCPVVGPVQFTDTWLAPRSGGRRHKGVDVFAPLGTPIVAPVPGLLRFGVDRLGGLAFHLWGDDGSYYYGAHLQRFGPRTGRVVAGELLGSVGKTGNAAHTPPHLHFEIHPDRRLGDPPAPVNPTPATKAACG